MQIKLAYSFEWINIVNCEHEKKSIGRSYWKSSHVWIRIIGIVNIQRKQSAVHVKISGKYIFHRFFVSVRKYIMQITSYYASFSHLSRTQNDQTIPFYGFIGHL